MQVIVEFADVRILAIGVLNKPRTSFGVNHLAKTLLHPPGIDGDAPSKLTTLAGLDMSSDESDSEHDHDVSLRLKTGALNGGQSLLYSAQ